MTETAIEARDLNKYFGDHHVVRDVSIRVNRGEIFGFLGPNGSGKTTTIRMLCGLLTPDSGGGTCLGFDLVRESMKIKRRVGYMTQAFSLYEDLTVAENLQFTGRIFHAGKARVAEVMDRFGLAERRGQVAGTLSGGWKQRLSLASAMLPAPELLLLDEPTAGVDPQARREFWDHIHYLALEGITVLVSTHYMDEAERCHEIAYLSSGRLIAHGSVDDVIAGSGLCVYSVTGPDLPGLARAIDGAPGIEMIAPFGLTLRVGGADPRRIEDAIRSGKTDERQQWRADTPNLEDIFIQKMRADTPGPDDDEGGRP